MKSLALEMALYSIKRRLIGGYGSRKNAPSVSKYVPHNGKKEMARRVRQMNKAGA